MKTEVLYRLIFCITIALWLPFLGHTEEAVNVEQTQTESPIGILKFLQQYPQWRDFFPVGTYSGFVSHWEPLISQNDGVELTANLFFLNNINACWETRSYIHKPFGQWPSGASDLQLSEFGKWIYGDVAPNHGIRMLVGLEQWLGHRRLDKDSRLRRNIPLYTEEEIKSREQVLKGLLTFHGQLKDKYPQTIIGFVPDDEPSLLAAAEGQYRIIKRNLQLPPITCNPVFGSAKYLARHLQPYCGDWYLNHNQSWNMAPQIRWLNQNYPGLFLHTMLWTTGSMREWNEAVLPGLRDDRPWPEELRLQIWQCVALGAKGIWAFLPGSSPGFRAGGPGLTNALQQPDQVHEHMAIWSRAGKLLGDVGPLLLTCRSEAVSPVTVSCEIYSRRPFFDGSAVDHGWLKDLERDRYYLVPWNNNIEAAENAVLSIPSSLIGDKSVYDIEKLQVVKPVKTGEYTVTLDAGDGKILLIASPAEFDKCRATVLQNRTKRARLVAALSIKRLQSLALMKQEPLKRAERALADGDVKLLSNNFVDAIELYSTVDAELKIALNTTQYYVDTQRALKTLGECLSKTDNLFRTHAQILELPFNQDNMFQLASGMFIHPRCGILISDWFMLASNYLKLQHEMLSAPTVNFPSIATRAASLSRKALENHTAVNEAIAKRLSEIRHSVRIALLTPDHKDPEYSAIYTRLYGSFHVTWFAPDGKKSWKSLEGKLLSPSDYDAIWIHQLYAHKPITGDALPSPVEILAPELLKPDLLVMMQDFTRNGGGLLLSGLAGLYAIPLGLEKCVPDQIRENGYSPQSRAIGLIAAPGYDSHPCFKGFPVAGFLTAGTYPDRGLLTECAWKKRQPSGMVIANELDTIYKQIYEYSSVVEYRNDKGKILVLGGLACDFTPNPGFSMPDQQGRPGLLMPGKNEQWHNRHGLRERIMRFVENSLVYLSDKNQFFIPDKSAVDINAKIQNREVEIGIPLDDSGWKFQLDPGCIGEKEKWFAPAHNDSAWKSIRIGLNWEAQGYDYDGYAWYRKKISIKNRLNEKCYIRFAAVDEKATVYLDGNLVGESHGIWDKPFEFEITRLLSGDTSEHMIAIKVYDEQQAGGIWKPIFIRNEKIAE